MTQSSWSNRRIWLTLLVLFWLSTGLIFVGNPWPSRNTAPWMGVGDCYLAFAALLMIWGPGHAGARIIAGSLLVFAALALHYVALIPIAYPFVFPLQYFMPLATVAVLALFFWVTRRRWGIQLVDQGTAEAEINPGRRTLTWTVGNLLTWMVVVGLMVIIGKRSMELTDVTGMADPWGTFNFSMPLDFVLPRLPVLLLAWAWYGIMWTLMTLRLLDDRPWTSWVTLQVGLLFVAFSLGELAISGLMALFDQPWPMLPVSMDYGVMFASDLQISFERYDPEFPHFRKVTPLVSLALTRASVWMLGMLLLRCAGYRLKRIASSSHPLDAN